MIVYSSTTGSSLRVVGPFVGVEDFDAAADALTGWSTMAGSPVDAAPLASDRFIVAGASASNVLALRVASGSTLDADEASVTAASAIADLSIATFHDNGRTRAWVVTTAGRLQATDFGICD